MDVLQGGGLPSERGPVVDDLDLDLAVLVVELHHGQVLSMAARTSFQDKPIGARALPAAASFLARHPAQRYTEGGRYVAMRVYGALIIVVLLAAAFVFFLQGKSATDSVRLWRSSASGLV